MLSYRRTRQQRDTAVASPKHPIRRSAGAQLSRMPAEEHHGEQQTGEKGQTVEDVAEE